MSTNTATSRWWLALDGKPDGPRTTAYITAALQTGTLSLMTPACPEGDCRWQPLGTWPELADVVRTSRRPSFLLRRRSSAAFADGHSSDRFDHEPVAAADGQSDLPLHDRVAPLYWMFGSRIRNHPSATSRFSTAPDRTRGLFLIEVLDTLVALGLVVLSVHRRDWIANVDR